MANKKNGKKAPAKKAPAKKAAPPKKATAKAKAKAPTTARASSSGAKTGGDVEAMLARLPPLTDIQRAAFGAQFSDERCSELGAETQSAGVVADATAFAHTIEEALGKNLPALRRYGHARFAWFLECIIALKNARAAQAAGGANNAAARTTYDQALIKATTVRHGLVQVLEMLAGDHGTDQTALEEARGTTETPKDVLASLKGLAPLADGWLRRTDKESKALVASVDLQQGDVDLAWASVQDLESSMEAASGKTRPVGRDSREVNRIEGRVLAEMMYARRAFADAHAHDAVVPVLNPGPATRHTMTTTKSTKRPAPKGANGGAPAPGASA